MRHTPIRYLWDSPPPPPLIIEKQTWLIGYSTQHSGHSCLRYRKHLLRSPQLIAASTESSKENSKSINLMAVSALPQEAKFFSAKIARMRRCNKKKIDMVFHIKGRSMHKLQFREPKKSFPVVRKSVVSIQTQAVKLHKNFVHVKYSLRVSNKYSLVFPSSDVFLPS